MAASGDVESDHLRTGERGRGVFPTAYLSSANSDVFSRTSGVDEVDDEEALRRVALEKLKRTPTSTRKAMERLEKLPTYERVRRVVLQHLDTDDKDIDVSKLGRADRQTLLANILQLNSGQGSQTFLQNVRDRLDKAGIALPTIEVRYHQLTITAQVHIGQRALPTLINSTLNVVEGALERIGLAPSKKRKLTVLKDVSGIIYPGRMTLLLGPPNAGKTTFLLALAGRLDPELKTDGRVTYNGHDLKEFVPRRTSAYISQYDVQDGEMTVRETLDFYGRCQGVGARYETLVQLARAEKASGIKPDADVDAFMKAAVVEGAATSIITDYILQTLGLDICADTFVGNEMRRGVSGGQRKRVTTGEMLVGPAKALFMDEISTGLDSSTTYQIVKFLRNAVHSLDGTMVVSLLQPAPETFELFDDLILLSEGQIVYQGPRDLVLDFFRDMGFVCPERKGVADFLQEVTSKKDQEQYWHDQSQPYAYVSVATFARQFKSFHVGKRIGEEMFIPYDRARSHPAALVKQKYALRRFDLFMACFSREVLLLQRNAFVYVFKVVQITIVASISMTVFLRTEMHHDAVSDGTKYMGALFFGLINVMFNGFAELVMTIDRLPVYYKQRDLLLYPAWAYTLPTWILKIPLSLMESGIWVILTYYVVGFAPEPSRFFTQFLLFFLVHQMALGLFRLIASVGRTMVIANTGGSFALLIVFVLGGFVLSRKNIHPWWIWGYWISPLMYSQNAVSVNEFLAPRWSEKFIQIGQTNRTIGERILESRGMFTDKKWVWIGALALIGYSILFNTLYTLALQYLNPVGKSQAVVSKEMLEERSSNSASSQRSPISASPQRSSNSASPQNGTQESRNAPNVGDEVEMLENGRPRKGMVLPFQPLALTFHNVNYYVDMPPAMKQHGVTENRLQLLKNVSGVFRPGILTALVGVSGAGKTTLMDVLAGRKTGGYIDGAISVSGYPKKQETFARIAGYCEQQDIHSPNLTVYESLVFSAWLRLSSDIDAKKRMKFVHEVMNLVELTPLRDALVGLPGVTGLSTEQRKRLTIAVELVANPSVIFMDEPTSGLDARAAAIVMRTVRNTVDTGRTVVCTIHQPSIDIFEAFDELLLMKRGGQVIYAGPLGRHSCELISYFEAVEGVPKISDGYNPATWMLEVTETSQEAHLGIDFADVYKGSTLHGRNEEMILDLSKPQSDEKELHFPTKFAQPFWVQCEATLWKQNKSHWRNPQYNVVRIFFTIIVAVMFGSIFWDLGQKRSKFQDLSNLMGAMYAAILFIGINNAGSVQPVVSVERSVFYRERAAGMYSALPYAFGQVVIELPYVFVQTVVYCAVLYSMIQFEWTAPKFFYFIFFSYFTFLYFTLYGMMTVSFTPNLPVATIVSSAFYGVWNLFAGFMIQRPQIPVWWQWYYWATPVAWSIYGLITSQLGDVNSTLVLADGITTQTMKEFLKHNLGFEYGFLGWVVLAHVGYVVVFAFVFAFSIKVFNFQRR